MLESHPTIYDTIGGGYQKQRVPDPRIARRILHALGDATKICNVGAGTGSYEPEDRQVTAVEPSQAMIAQRTNAHPVICATAENLPFESQFFDAAMAVLTIHHWVDVNRGLSEMKRIAPRQVIFTFDPMMNETFWLTRDYLPESIELDHKRGVPLQHVMDSLNTTSVQTIEIPHDCMDGFQGAYWRRPAEYLKADVRASISTFAQLPATVVQPAMRKLSDDLASGAWTSRYAHLLEKESLDLGYRLVVGQEPDTK